jgi:hypothetical protein
MPERRPPLEFVAALRDRTARAERPDWDFDSIGALEPDPDLLCHLAPPQLTGRTDTIERWHALHRPGLCYYRRGPGFLAVHDQRPVSWSAELLLDGPEEVDLFERLLRPGLLVPGDPAARRLRAARLLLESDGMAVTLPYRETRLALPVDITCMPSNLLVPSR